MQVKSFYLSLDKASDMFDPKKIKFVTIPWEELEKEFSGFSKSEAFRQAEAYIWEKEISELFAEGVKEAFLEGYVQGFLKSAEESRKKAIRAMWMDHSTKQIAKILGVSLEQEQIYLN
jgi:hypothetical protein